MESAHHCVNFINTGNFHRVMNRINDSGMRTTGKDNQPFVFQIHDNRGVVFDGIPNFLSVLLAMRKRPSRFEIRATGNFAQKKNRIFQ